MNKKDLQKLYIEFFEDHYKVIKTEKYDYYEQKYFEFCSNLKRDPKREILDFNDDLPF